MASLSAPEQRWIVLRLAVFDEPSEVAEAFKAEFGKVITRQQVWEYDCSKEVNRSKRSKELVDLFDDTREEYKVEVEDVAIANKRWRLQEMQGLYRKAVKEKRYKAAAAILEQAAKDVGDAFTNKRDLTSAGQPFKALVGVEIDEI